MSYSDVIHFSNMVSGCESINSGEYKSPNSIYAQTVLKLHANDAGLYAGQEGFLDNVKKGAGKFLEWVKKLIRAIKDYIKGISKDDRTRISELDKIIKETKFEDVDFSVTPSLFTPTLTRIKDRLEPIEDADGLPSVKPLIKETNDIAASLEGLKYRDLLDKGFKLRNNVTEVIEKYNKFIETKTNGLKEEDAVPAEVKEAVKIVQSLSNTLQIVNHIPEKVQGRVNTIANNWDHQHKAKKDRVEDAEFEKAKLEKGKDK